MKKLITTVSLIFFLVAVSAQTKEEFVVAFEVLNLRSGPGLNHNIITVLKQGDKVDVLEKNQSGWWLVEQKGIKGYVSVKNLIPYSYTGWEKKNYKTGAIPECENITPVFDKELDNYLKINVGSSTDVVVKLIKKDTVGDLCIRMVYIKGGDSFNMINIPEGRYYLKLAYGKDYVKKNEGSLCMMKFMTNPIYEKGTDILDFNKVIYPDEIVGNQVRSSWSLPSFELFLDVKTNKTQNNFNSEIIGENEFNL